MRHFILRMKVTWLPSVLGLDVSKCAVLYAFFLTFLPPSAMAGPWVQEKGYVYARGMNAREDHDTYMADRRDLYAEWGMSDDWTLTAKYEQVHFDTSDLFDHDGWRVSARRQLWATGPWSLTGELGMLQGQAVGGSNGCDQAGFEGALGFGWSGKSELGDSFAGLTLMSRQHENGCHHERVEAVAGYRDEKGWGWALQYWGERGAGTSSEKIDIARSYRHKWLEAGASLRQEISGQFDETALSLFLALYLGK